MEQIALYFRQGSSDKIYQASITQENGGYVVQFAYGRRGTALQSGRKTPAPVPYERAKDIYDRLVAQKLQKGYDPGEAGTPYQHSDKASEVSGILPQLLNPVDSEQAATLVRDPEWALQEKADGRRLLLRKTARGIEGINRKGLIVSLPGTVAEAAAEITGTFILDGECVGDTLIVFDLLEGEGKDYRGLQYRLRLKALGELIPVGGRHLHVIETAYETAAKAALLQRLRTENREGVVFRKLRAPSVPGRPASGGDALKHKFYESASFIVSGINEQRSVSLSLCDGDRMVAAGNVTIPPNHQIPAVGAVIDCRYLYAFPESGCIFQPLYLGERNDIAPGECSTAQLKLKPAVTERAA